MNTLNTVVGSYVSYKNNTFIVVEERGGLYLLLSPSAGKVQVSVSNTTVLSIKPAVLCEYRSGKYLVTSKNLIISLTSGKIMKWNDTHIERFDILNIADMLVEINNSYRE